MRPRSAALLVTFAALAAGAVPAEAAEIRVNRSCFADPADREDTVALSGSGFAPNADFRVTLDGRPLTEGRGRTDASGRLSGRFLAPSVAEGSRQHRFRLGVRQGASTAVTTFTVSRLLASFAPRSGDPASLRVRFRLYGFALQGATRPSVYAHYVSPGGRLARTVRLGRATTACGFLRTAPRRLFGFSPRRGAWTLQFDTRTRYTPGTSRSSFLFYSLGVNVR